MRSQLKIDGDLLAIKNKVLVCELEFGIKKLNSGFILPDDDMTQRGIRPRWARVFRTGPEVNDVKEGEYVLLKHGRWTRGFDISLKGEDLRLHMIEYPNAILAISKNRPKDLDNVYKTYE